MSPSARKSRQNPIKEKSLNLPRILHALPAVLSLSKICVPVTSSLKSDEPVTSPPALVLGSYTPSEPPHLPHSMPTAKNRELRSSLLFLPGSDPPTVPEIPTSSPSLTHDTESLALCSSPSPPIPATAASELLLSSLFLSRMQDLLQRPRIPPYLLRFFLQETHTTPACSDLPTGTKLLCSTPPQHRADTLSIPSYPTLPTVALYCAASLYSSSATVQQRKKKQEEEERRRRRGRKEGSYLLLRRTSFPPPWTPTKSFFSGEPSSSLKVVQTLPTLLLLLNR